MEDNRDWSAFNNTKRFKKGDFIHHRNFICIYSGTNKNGAIQFFAFIPWYWDKNTSKRRYDVCPTEKPKIGVGYINNETRLATEDEKTLLLSAIEYNGYEWDSEKLELRKKEPEFKVIAEESSELLENKNVSPLLYGSIDSKQREILLKRLEELYNNLGIDTEFNTPDYLLAEYTLNCLVSYGNTVTKNIEKGYIKPTIL